MVTPSLTGPRSGLMTVGTPAARTLGAPARTVLFVGAALFVHTGAPWLFGLVAS